MQYWDFVEVYEALGKTTKKLEKTKILAEFFIRLKKSGKPEWIYLLRGRVLPEYDSREFGISTQLAIKAISTAFGVSDKEVINKFNSIGDLGEVAQAFALKRKQSTLFSKKLKVDRVYTGLHKLFEIEGKGSIDKKLSYISEILSDASDLESKYIIRTLLSDLRVGVADALLRDALCVAFFPGEEIHDFVQGKYDLVNDWAEIFKACGSKKDLEEIELIPGKPLNVMLTTKATNVEEAFEEVGRPAAFEYKYDGFRVLIHKDKNGKISLFTRKLENVTNQFPDVVEAAEKHISGKNWIFDSEVVGYDAQTGKYKPFEAISQRIKRKYDILELKKELPVEVNIFDVLYFNGKSTISMPFKQRRELVEKNIASVKKVIRPAIQLITDDAKKAQEFYNQCLNEGEEGIMVKNLNAEYQQGRKVGYMVKLKPEVKDLDLVIVGAEHGTGKRGGWLTSFIVACKSEGEFLEVGKVSSGLKEKESEGTSYEEMTKLLKPLIISKDESVVRVKPKIVVAVTYQNIQKSPSYSSGYALRFPRITHYRPDRGLTDIASIDDIEKSAKAGR